MLSHSHLKHLIRRDSTKNLPHNNNESDWYLKTRGSSGYCAVPVNEIIITSDEDTKLALYAECIQTRSIAPLDALSLFIPEFHFITTGHKINWRDDLFQGGIIYCVYEATEILYVGQSYMLRSRLLYHHKVYSKINDDNVTIKGYFVPFDVDRLIYELFLINTLRARLNKKNRFY